MANKLFGKVLDDTDLLLGETGGVDHDEATIETDVDNYGGTNVGRDELNVALGVDGTKTSATLRPTVNITLKNFIKYLARKLNSRYLQNTATPLSELSTAEKKAYARVMLDILSSGETSTAITAAVAADTSTLKTANKLHELSLEEIGQGIQDVYDNLSIQSINQTQAQIESLCYTKAQTEAEIAADITHFKVWADESLLFSELSTEYKRGYARTNLDVYSKGQTDDQIGILGYTRVAADNRIVELCYTKAQVDAKPGIVKYHYVQDYGGADIDNTVAIQADVYNFWSIRTSNDLNDWVRLPSLADRPNLVTGTICYLKCHRDSDMDLVVAYYNTDMPTQYIQVAKRDCVSFIFNGTTWEYMSFNNL